MELVLLRLFQRQVAIQCEFALFAEQDLVASLEQRDTVRTFYDAQNFLNASANIAKALWGSGGRLSAEREELRKSLKIDAVSPMPPIQLMAMRNNFEHYDQRLDEWWAKTDRHNHADMNVGPRNMIGGFEDSDMFRSFDPATWELMFWGESFPLGEIAKEIRTLLPIARAEANKPHGDATAQGAGA